ATIIFGRPSFPSRRSSDLHHPAGPVRPSPRSRGAAPGRYATGHVPDGWRIMNGAFSGALIGASLLVALIALITAIRNRPMGVVRSEEHTSELQSRENLVCR